MKTIRFNLIISCFILLLFTVNAQAKWWIFGQSNDEVNINYMYINKIAYDESGSAITIFKETLQDGLIYLKGKTSTRKGKIGGVRVSINDKETWEEAKLSENGAFEYSFRPDLGKAYVLYVEVMDTAGKTNDIESTRKEVKLSDQSIMAIIRETLDKMIESYQSEDPNRFMSYVSDDFTGDETNLDWAIRKDFSAFDNIDLRYTVNNIAAGSKGMVYVSINFNRSVLSAKDGKRYSDRGMTEFIFKLAPERVYSMKNPLIFGLSDAENVATGTVKSGSQELNICLSATNETGLCESGIKADSNVVSGRTTLNTTSFVNFQGFIFADEEVTDETNESSIIGDFAILIEGLEMSFIRLRSGVVVKDMGMISLDQINTADESGYNTFAQGGAIQGHSYVFKLSNNTYGAIEITSVTASGMRKTAMLKYKYQPDGTRNF